MSEKYYQEYGPIKRRRVDGQIAPDDPPPPEELPDPPERPSRRRPKRKRRWPITLLLLALTVAVALVLPYATNLFASDRAFAGVTFQGRPVGGMRQEQIRASLEERYGAFAQAPLTISFEGRTWTPSLEQLGAKLDLDQLSNNILLAGHHGDPLQRVREQWAIWNGGLDIAPRVTVDTAVLQMYLTSISADLEQPPRDAALSITAGKVLPTAARSGRQVLVDATMIDVVRSLQSLSPQTISLRTRTLPPALDDSAIAPAVADARAVLKGPLTIKQNQREWTWDEERIGSLLTVIKADSRMNIGINPDRLSREVEKLAQVVDSPSAEPSVNFNNGKPVILKEGQIGWRLKQPEATEAISTALRLQPHTVELPVEELSPQVTAKTLPTLGLVDLVAEGKSSFEGSAEYRITNIKAGAARMNGVLIPPGAEFSFNTQLGAVDESNGFVQGYAVIGNRTQLEWGGGVCQVSTTVFRAAFWAGVPITERHAHPFYISWYDAYSFPGGDAAPGLDATIFTGVQDLKFANDTQHWMLMQAIVDEANQVLTIRLYGTKLDRTVTAVGPEINNVVPPPAQAVYMDDASLPNGTVKQTDHARRGMDIAVYRVITAGGVKQIPETFFTRFKAWPDVFVRGTGS